MLFSKPLTTTNDKTTKSAEYTRNVCICFWANIPSNRCLRDRKVILSLRGKWSRGKCSTPATVPRRRPRELSIVPKRKWRIVELWSENKLTDRRKISTKGSRGGNPWAIDQPKQPTTRTFVKTSSWRREYCLQETWSLMGSRNIEPKGSFSDHFLQLKLLFLSLSFKAVYI